VAGQHQNRSVLEMFRDNGFDLLEILPDLDGLTLEIIRIKMIGHKTLLCKKIKDLTAIMDIYVE
jgi:hypothetical protein